jgi:multidrug efflux pump subunit AcrB
MNRLIEFFARQGVFANIIFFFVMIVGIYSAFKIPKEFFPNIDFEMITVTTIYPGSSAEEVEKLITNPIERDLREVDGIKRVTSASAANRSTIVLQLEPNQNVRDSKADIQDVIDRVAGLPSDAESPIVRSLESRQNPVIEVTLFGDVPEMELRAAAKRMERELEQVPDVARIVFRGLENLEIQVQADPDKLSFYRLSLDDLVRAIQQTNVSIPGGTLRSTQDDPNSMEFIVRTIGDFKSSADVENTVIRANELGQAIRIRDVATVKEGLAERAILNRLNGRPAISLTVLQKENIDVIRLVDQVQERAQAIAPTLGMGIEVDFVNDTSSFIRNRLGILTNNMIVGLSLVLIILAIILPARVAMIVAVGIPFAFLATIATFFYMGISLNMLSLLGLIIVIGMLVDDAVVVTENGTRYIQAGHSPTRGAILGAQQIWRPITASIMTSIAVFMPLMMMSGIVGKFMAFIPIGVIIALLFSLFECFFILPHHMAAWVKPMPKMKAGKRSISEKIDAVWNSSLVPLYIGGLKQALRHRYILILGMFLLFIGSITFATQKMRIILFPAEGIEVFMINAEAPIGTSLNRMSNYMQPIEDVISKLPADELQNFTTKIGIQQQDPNDPDTQRGSHYAQVTVYLTPEMQRTRIADEIINDLRNKIQSPEGLTELLFTRLRTGPPVGSPISIGVRGDTYEEILPAVEHLQNELAQIQGVKDITHNYNLGKQEFQIHVKTDEAAASGLSVTQIGTTVRAAFEGLIATSIQGLDEKVDVRVSLPERYQKDEASFEKLLIPNQRGNLISLERVSDIRQDQGIAAYLHEDNQRQVRVLGDIDETLNTSRAVNAMIRARIPEFREQFPTITYHFGGEDMDTAESFQSLFRAFIIAIAGVFLILILLFKQILQPLLILLTIPLGIIAVIWTFFLHGMPLSFLAMLGIVALSGIIVNNAIVLVDFINNYRREGKGRWHSIMEASRVRIRPIFLTTVTTVCGILPTAYGIGGIDKFVVPIALSLGWGIGFGSLMAAFVFPASVAILDDLQSFLRRLFGKENEENLETSILNDNEMEKTPL